MFKPNRAMITVARVGADLSVKLQVVAIGDHPDLGEGSPNRGTNGSTGPGAGWPTYISLPLGHSYLNAENNRQKN
jgi:hypothetical protein